MSVNGIEIAYKAAVNCGAVFEGVATTDTINDMVDTHLTQPDDYWNGSYIIRGYDDTGVFQMGRIISDYTLSTHKIVYDTTLGYAIAPDKDYRIIKKVYPYAILLQSLNQALADMGDIPLCDTTHVTTTSYSYNLTTGISAENIRAVYIKHQTEDRYVPVYNWRVENTSTNTKQLILPKLYPSGLPIKIYYLGKHPVITDLAFSLDDTFSIENIQTIIYRTTANLLRWKMNTSNSADPVLLSLLQTYENKVVENTMKYPVFSNIRRTPRFIKVS